MDNSGAYMNVQLVKPDSLSPSGAEPDASYAEVNFKTPSALRIRTDRGPHKHEPNENIGNRPYRLICLHCLVTFVLFVTVVGLSIHVSQIRPSEISSDRNYQEINSTLQSKLSALNSKLSELNRMHNDLRHQFTEMETKYRSVNETKAQICELLTYRREGNCSEDWVTNKDRCYYASTFETSFHTAMQACSDRYSRLLEINSSEEASFVSRNLVLGNHVHWIGKCETGNANSWLLYKVSSGTSNCRVCNSYPGWKPCSHDHRFICEKPAPLFRENPEKIRELCQQPVEAT